MAALGAAGGIRAAFGAGRAVFAAAAVAGHVRLGARRLATGGPQDSCGKNRSQDHHCFHVIYLWLFVDVLKHCSTHAPTVAIGKFSMPVQFAFGPLRLARKVREKSSRGLAHPRRFALSENHRATRSVLDCDSLLPLFNATRAAAPKLS